MSRSDVRATIFDVQRFSVHDGPGIRTTVFFKGCPLQCDWCHNPEGISPDRQRLLFDTKCIGCLKCVEVCPEGSSDAKQPAAPVHCQLCGRCVAICPTEARSIAGREVNVEELFDLVMQDRAFYRGDGGVTLGGGEPLAQWAFVRELANRLRQRGVDVALDTCAAAARAVIEQVPHHVDRLLVDLKLLTSDIHRRWTGMDNAGILDAISYFAQTMDGRLVLSVPLIPGVHDEQELLRMAGFIDRLPNQPKVRLLPYEPFGESKYAALGKQQPDFDHDTTLLIDLAREIFTAHNINI